MGREGGGKNGICVCPPECDPHEHVLKSVEKGKFFSENISFHSIYSFHLFWEAPATELGHFFDLLIRSGQVWPCMLQSRFQLLPSLFLEAKHQTCDWWYDRRGQVSTDLTTCLTQTTAQFVDNLWNHLPGDVWSSRKYGEWHQSTSFPSHKRPLHPLQILQLSGHDNPSGILLGSSPRTRLLAKAMAKTPPS